MESLLLVSVVVTTIILLTIGSSLGYRKYNGNMRKGNSIVLSSALFIMALGVFIFSSFRDPKMVDEVAKKLEARNMVDFMVLKNCDSYIEPSLESEVDSELKEGEVYTISNPKQYKFFYTIIWKDSGKSFVLKQYLKSLEDVEAEEEAKEKAEKEKKEAKKAIEAKKEAEEESEE